MPRGARTRRVGRWFVLVAAPWLALSPGPPRAEEVLSGSARAFAAEVIILRGAKIRLAGVVAPAEGSCVDSHSGLSCPERAKQALNELLRGQSITCRLERKVGHGSFLGTCNVAGIGDLGARLVQAGWATAGPGGGAPRYSGQEAEARAAKRGLWAND